MEMNNYNKKTFLSFWLVPLTLVFMLCSSCGFQGRKYTTGHYWNGRNEIEYDTQNENENENENENGNEELKKYNNKIEKEKTNEHIKKIAVSHQYFETSENIKRNSKLNYSEVADTIDPSEIPGKQPEQIMNVESIPPEIDKEIKALDDKLFSTLLLSILFGAVLFLTLMTIYFYSELAPIGAILQLIFDVIWIKRTIHFFREKKKLSHIVDTYRSENLNKKWFKKTVESLESDSFLNYILIIGYIICNYLFFSLMLQYN
jgi:preprotein translocase subunit SecF